MDGVDKERVQKIVYEMSKGSKYFDNEERKEAFMRGKIDSMRVQCAKLTPADISQYQMVFFTYLVCDVVRYDLRVAMFLLRTYETYL